MCILCILEDTFSLGAVHLMVLGSHVRRPGISVIYCGCTGLSFQSIISLTNSLVVKILTVL